jgi:hypothetical protein
MRSRGQATPDSDPAQLILYSNKQVIFLSVKTGIKENEIDG